MTNAVMFLDREQFAREAPVLVRDEDPETVKRFLIGRLPAQDGNVIFCQLALGGYSARVGLGPGSKFLGTVYLISDKLAEAIETMEYLQLFDSDGDDEVSVLTATWARMEVKERLEKLCYIHVLMDDDFPDYTQGRPGGAKETEYGWTEEGES